MSQQASTDQDEPATKNYTLKPVTKLLPSQTPNARDAESSATPANATSARSNKSEVDAATAPRFRDITEDDDGYHPYADVPDNRPLFEDNPWR